MDRQNLVEASWVPIKTSCKDTQYNVARLAFYQRQVFAVTEVDWSQVHKPDY